MLILAIVLLVAGAVALCKAKMAAQQRVLFAALGTLLLAGSFIANLVACCSSDTSPESRQSSRLEESRLIIPAQRWAKAFGGSGTLAWIPSDRKAADAESLEILKAQLPGYTWKEIPAGEQGLLTAKALQSAESGAVKGILCLASLPVDPEPLEAIFAGRKPIPFLLLNPGPAGRDFLLRQGTHISAVTPIQAQVVVQPDASQEALFDLNFRVLAGHDESPAETNP
jgi:hypothetical protein